MAKPDDARREVRRSNPLGWLILGFICGVVATLGVLIALSGEFEDEGDYSSSDRSDAPAADDRASGSPDEERPSRIVVPEATEPEAPPVAEQPSADEAVNPPVNAPSSMPAPAPDRTPPRAAGPAEDPQIAEDAAASGMTARAPRR